MEISGSMASHYIKTISQIRNNPIALSNLLDELTARINHRRLPWLLEIFDTAKDCSGRQTEDQFNLGIVLAKCQERNLYARSQHVERLQTQLQQVQYAVQQEQNQNTTVTFFGFKLFENLSPNQKLEKKTKKELESAIAQRDIAHRYINILNDILEQDLKPSGYHEKKWTSVDFILHLLLPKNNVSILHIAAIHQDDLLSSRILQLLNNLINKGADVSAVYKLLTTRANFFHDSYYKPYDKFTIGHCIANNMVGLPSSVNEFLVLLHNMLARGIATSDLRLLLTMPIADVPEENIDSLFQKLWPVLPENIKLQYASLKNHLSIDFLTRQQHVTQPIIVAAPIPVNPWLPATDIATVIGCDQIPPPPSEVPEITAHFVPIRQGQLNPGDEILSGARPSTTMCFV